MLALGECFPQPARAMAAGLPRQDDVCVTSKQLVRFHTNELDEMLCKLNSNEYELSCEQNSTLPQKELARNGKSEQF